jgi:hypothetical protein
MNNHSSARGLTEDRLGFHNICAKWVIIKANRRVQGQTFDNHPRYILTAIVRKVTDFWTKHKSNIALQKATTMETFDKASLT